MPLNATSRWKEEVVIEDEGHRAFVFECAWGVEPFVAYLPSVTDWEMCVPSWLWGRRDEVVQALVAARHLVKDGPYPRLAGAVGLRGVECRAATVADAAALAEVFVSAWRVGFQGLLPQSVLEGLDVNESRARWEADLARQRSGPPYVRVAELRGVVCGFAVYGPSRDADAATDSGEVFALHVLPAHWGHGAGAALLRAAVTELGALGATQARLWVIDKNARARRFYEHNGWRWDEKERARTIAGGAVRELRYCLAD